MAMAVKVLKKKSKKVKIPREITEESSIKLSPEIPDAIIPNQTLEATLPKSDVINDPHESVEIREEGASHGPENYLDVTSVISPPIGKCVIPEIVNLKNDITCNVISPTSIKISGEDIKEVNNQDFQELEGCFKPADSLEIQSMTSNIMISEHHQQDKLPSSCKYLITESNSDLSVHKQLEDLSSDSEYSKLSANVLTLHENLKSLNEQKFHLEDKVDSANVILDKQEKLMEVAPSAPPLTKCSSINRIHSLDESSLCSLYPLQTHQFHLPSDPVIRNHPLFALLTDYLCSCNHLESSLQKHESLITTAENHRKSVWTLTEEQVVELGKCNDQIPVAATYCRTSAVKDERHLSQLGNCLSALRENLHAECAFYLFDSETHHLRVEFFVQTLEESQAVFPSRIELHTCICILFSFARRQDLNSSFISKVREWILRLGKALLRIALPSDRLLLLSQILQCPKGVSTWAIPLIQFEPPPQLSTFTTAVSCRPELEIVVEAISSIINSPALKQIEKASRNSMIEEVWVVLDSEGEEEVLDVPGDEDLCKILDCIPLKAAVVHVLGLVGEECPSSLSAVDLLRYFSLSNSVVKILGVGLLKSRLQRFPSFCKRLTVLLQHVIHLISDIWELSASLNCVDRDPAMQARVAVEFDSLFMKAVGYLFHCVIRSYGWENLTELPFRLLSLDARWNILNFLHHFEENKWFDGIEIPSQDTEDWLLEIKNSATSFGNMIKNTTDKEASFLLITLKNLAVTCEASTFAEAVAYDLFMVGHLSPLAEEREFSLAANSHLASILSKHPCLFSTLIKWLKDVPPEVEKGILKLFSTLPLHMWEPSAHDLTILSSWILQNDPQTVKNSVSRNILIGISWRENCIGDPLPLDTCYAAATLALDACLTWDSKSRMSQLATSVIWPKSAISSWAWSLVGSLPIHPYDRRKTSSNYNQPYAHSECAFLEVLNRGFRENHPLSFLLAVLATDIGHNWTNAEKDAFSHLSIVVANGKHTAAISALYLILPLFIDNVDKLISCKSFEKLLQSLLFADHTYMQMATNLIISNFPGVILTDLGNMMVSHLEESYKFAATCSSFVCLWLNCIFLTPNWMHKKEALYLADLVIRSAVLDESGKAWNEAICLLKKHKEQYTPIGGSAPSSALSSLFTMLSMEPSLGSPHPQSLVVRSSWPEFPWFVLAALDVEEEHEITLWDRIQMDLGSLPCNVPINSIILNNALKNACQKSDIQPFPATCLTIFRWARQALDTSIGHPVFPLLWARFFSLYFKIFSSCTTGLSTIFEGHSSWANFLSSMKKKLNESHKWYYKEAASDGDDQELMLWLKHCARLFGAFGAWLEDKQQSIPPLNLPVQYAPDRLEGNLLYSKRRIWRKDYIYTVGIRRNILSNLKAWEALRGLCDQTVSNEDFLLSSHSHPLQRITERLHLCSDPPSIYFPPQTDPPIRFEHVHPASRKELSSKAIRSCILPLLECARLYSLYNSENTALDCSLLELLPHLYEDINKEFTQVVHCKPSSSQKNSDELSSCSSPARITFKVKESQICEGVRSQVDRNLNDRDRLINSVLHEAPHDACAASVSLESIVKSLIVDKKNISHRSKVYETALVLLNSLVDMFSEDTISQYLPTKKLVNSCVETLGQEFVVGEESQLLPLLLKMMERPQLVGILAPLLSPSTVSNGAFLQAYDVVIRHLPNMDENVAFVLLSKFDIGHRLIQDNPPDIERVHLVHLIIDGLSSSSTLINNEPTVIAGLLQRHLRTLLVNNVPELFLKVIEFLLKASGDHCLQTFVWFDVLDAIISLGNGQVKSQLPVLRADISPEHLAVILKEFATRQRILTFDQVKNVANFIGDYFHDERLHFGLHGLYPKYRSHIKAIQVLLELLGHLLIAASNGREMGAFTSSSFVGYLWPSLCNMFGPWLLPYWEDQLKEEGAHWILELMDGHPPLTPWIPSDSTYALTIALSFSRCICFLMDMFPGHSNILSPVWEMYFSSIAQTGVGCYILEIIHDAFSKLPWNQFWPSLQDLKNMVDVMERAPTECHLFIFHVITQIRWKEWVGSVAPSNSLCAEALSRLLKLIVLLSSDFSLKKVNHSDLHPLLIDVKAFPWHNLRASDYALLVDLFIKNTKPEIVLGWNASNKTEDLSLLLLLQWIAGVYDPQQEEGLPPRCLLFFCAITKLLFIALEGMEQDKTAEVKDAFAKLLKELEAAVVKGFPGRGSSKQMLEMADVIKVVLLPHLSANSLKCTEAFCEVLSSKSTSLSTHELPNTLCAKGLLYALNSSNLTQSQLHLLVESALEVSLIDEQDVFPLLDNIPKLLNFQGDSKVMVADALSSSGHLLALSACLRKSSSLSLASDSSTSQSIGTPLHLLVHRWLPAVTLMENVEAKVPLLWAHALLLAQHGHGKEVNPVSEEALQILASSLINVGNCQEGIFSGLLGAMGLKKKLSPSIRFKIFCTAVAAFLYAYLEGKEVHGSRLKDAQNSVEKICKRHKEFNEVATIFNSTVMKPNLSLKHGNELIEKLLGRLYIEKRCYVQCIY